jgi:hypothetical protein
LNILDYLARGVLVLLRGGKSDIFLLKLEFELLILGLAIGVVLLFSGADLVFVFCQDPGGLGGL